MFLLNFNHFLLMIGIVYHLTLNRALPQVVYAWLWGIFIFGTWRINPSGLCGCHCSTLNAMRSGARRPVWTLSSLLVFLPILPDASQVFSRLWSFDDGLFCDEINKCKATAQFFPVFELYMVSVSVYICRIYTDPDVSMSDNFWTLNLGLSPIHSYVICR